MHILIITLYIYIYIYIYHIYLLYINVCVTFTIEGFLEVAIENWHAWDSNPRPLNSEFCLSYLAISSTRTQSRLCTVLHSFRQFNPLFSVRINLWSFPESVTTFTKIEISYIYKFLYEILHNFVKFADMFFLRLTSAVICIFKISNYFRHAKLFRTKVLWCCYTFIQLFY